MQLYTHISQNNKNYFRAHKRLQFWFLLKKVRQQGSTDRSEDVTTCFIIYSIYLFLCLSVGDLYSHSFFAWSYL